MNDLLNYGFNPNLNNGAGIQSPIAGTINPLQFSQTPPSADNPYLSLLNYGGVNQPQLSPQANAAFNFPGSSQNNGQPINLAQPLGNWQKANIGIQAGSALLNGYLGLKQYGLAKDQLRFSKDSFNKNYQNQVKAYNTELEQKYRDSGRAGSPGYESVDDYVKRHGVS